MSLLLESVYKKISEKRQGLHACPKCGLMQEKKDPQEAHPEVHILSKMQALLQQNSHRVRQNSKVQWSEQAKIPLSRLSPSSNGEVPQGPRASVSLIFERGGGTHTRGVRAGAPSSCKFF